MQNNYIDIVEHIKKSDFLIDDYLNNGVENLDIYKIFKIILSKIDPYTQHLVDIMKNINNIQNKKYRLLIYKIGLYYIYKLLDLKNDELDEKIDVYLNNPKTIDNLFIYYGGSPEQNNEEISKKLMEIAKTILTKIQSISRLSGMFKTLILSMANIYKFNQNRTDALINVKLKLEHFFENQDKLSDQEKKFQADELLELLSKSSDLMDPTLMDFSKAFINMKQMEDNLPDEGSALHTIAHHLSQYVDTPVPLSTLSTTAVADIPDSIEMLDDDIHPSDAIDGGNFNNNCENRFLLKFKFINLMYI